MPGADRLNAPDDPLTDFSVCDCARYLEHLAHTSVHHQMVVASEDVINQFGIVLLRRGTPLGALAAEKMRGHRLNRPVDEVLRLRRPPDAARLAGIFLARLLPGFRTFLAPFVGIVNLPPLRALIPMALSSALWYAGLVWAGMRVGEEWAAINNFIGHLNRTLAVVAVVVGGFVGWTAAATPPSNATCCSNRA